jgi:glycosyltransferase involved in cell wall biosynthesis
VKRAQDVLRVLAELEDQPNIKLLILAGESFEPFRKIVKRMGIDQRVMVKENVLDIENYLHASDAGLYTSERESFGMGVLETMSFGKPVVATRVGGVTEIMRDGETGFLKRLGDVRSMAAAVRTLANDPELSASMGETARIRAEQEFSSQKSVEQYLDLYRRTIRDCPD